MRGAAALVAITACAGATVPEETTPPPTAPVQGTPEPAGSPDRAELLPADLPLPDRYVCPERGGNSACFVRVPGGSFTMGAQSTDPAGPSYDADARPDEAPPHTVTLSSFWILRNEVLAGAYGMCVKKAWCTEVPDTGGDSTFGDTARSLHPINGISWEGAQRFCAFLGGRLPTEAEWEYAARGADQPGVSRRFPWGDTPACAVISSDPSATAAKDGERPADKCAGDGTTAFGQLRRPSPFGLSGMAGSVWEWTADWYAPDAYATHGAKDPTGPGTGTARVQRGGGWSSETAEELRSAARGSMLPDQRFPDVGFRCVRADGP